MELCCDRHSTDWILSKDSQQYTFPVILAKRKNEEKRARSEIFVLQRKSKQKIVNSDQIHAFSTNHKKKEK